MSAIVRRLGCAVLALGLAAAPAIAAEDAGTQSVFAYGAGNRALAMGGAFVAAADDASSMIWNPAGLGLVSRAEIQGAQSVELGLGVVESYVAFTVPSWRWGGAGLSIRHFGVGDVERRDDRNGLIAGGVEDQEFEIALGYGRTLGDAWTVGGAFKLQRQSLAGFSGSGLGVDLGVGARPAAVLGLDVPWAQGLTWGLGLRNAVPPAVRLDVESVSDPAVVRTGLGWRGVTSGGRSLQVEVDLSRAAGGSPRLHAGLEYWLHPAAALRTGFNDGVLAAGAEFRWRDLSFDYAFENAELAPAHRAGLSLHFGATTEESRSAHLRREDERAEARLAEASRRRLADQVAALLARATDARGRGDLDDALEAIALIETLEPGRADAAAIEASCLRDRAAQLEGAGDFATAALAWDRALAAAPGDTSAIAAAARCRAESDRRARRTSEIRARFARAMDAFAEENLIVARDGFRDVLAGEPTDAEAARMLERTELILARRADEAAEQAARARRTAEAAPAPRVAARPGDAVATARPSAPRLSDRQAEELYQRGLEALRDQREDDAVRYWELVWSARPAYREVASHLKREYLTRGMEAFAAGRLDDAVADWERVLRIDPNDARARGYLSRAQTQRARSREILGAER